MRSFSIIGQIREIETIASGHGIRELATLNRRFGRGRWRKMKGVAEVKFDDGTIATAELH